MGMAKAPPTEVRLTRKAIQEFFKAQDRQGRRIGSAKCAVYAFYDYDGEPIYVGQTVEGLSGRVSRHLTGRRSDPVGKFVLDPFEVLTITVWPFFDAESMAESAKKARIDAAEYTVYRKALRASRFGAVLNETPPRKSKVIRLPRDYTGRVVPDMLFEERRHPDVRIARRAQTFANLARLVSERQVGEGIRHTLDVQAQRLAYLTAQRI